MKRPTVVVEVPHWPHRDLMRRFVTFTAVALLSGLPPPLLSDDGKKPGLEDHPKERAEWNAMLRRDRDGRVLTENRLNALKQKCEMPVDPSMARAVKGSFLGSDVDRSLSAPATFGGTVWQSLGPLPMQSSTSNPNRQYGNVGGRVDAIAVHPTNTSIILLGSATGGIWKSTDAGQTWRPVSDNAPALAISHVAFSPANPSIAYAATGEADKGTFDGSLASSYGTYLGGGLLKSTDAGETWFRVDTDLPADAIISRVVPHPTDTQRVIVGLFRIPNYATGGFSIGGIYQSTNGGVSFSSTYSHRIVDLVQDPNTPDRLFMSTGGCNGCTTYGVLVSSDFGATWQPSSLSWSTSLGFIKLGISRTNPAVLYASVLATDNTHSGSSNAGIYVSQNGGTTWQKKAAHPGMCPTAGSSEGSNQCFYDHFITPDPVNPSTVYFGSISIFKSADSGSTWVKQVDVYTTSGVATVHPDQHTGVFGASGGLLIGNDGGVYRSYDGANTFENLNATLNASQFQSLALHSTNRDFAMGGTQDNGSQRYTGSLAWSDRIQGDGGFVLIRKDAPSQILAAHYRAYFEYSTDGGDNFSGVSDCTGLMNCDTGDSRETMAFYPPAAATGTAPGTVLVGTNRIWYNETFGADSTKWKYLTSGAIASASGDFLLAIDAPTDRYGAIWAGSWQGGVYFSPPGGLPFQSVGAALPGAPVTKIVSVTADGRSAYATFAGYLGSPSKHVFRTTDGGTTWANISSNLPDVPVLTMAIDPSDPTDLFIGTDVGVFRSTSGGASWSQFNAGLPNVPVYDLKFHALTKDLWAATYGRGVWRVNSGGGVVCTADTQTMCLIGGRYRVTSQWTNQYAGGAVSTMNRATLTDATGAFWIADANTYEYLIRISTATNNGRAWIAIPTFTDVEFSILVEDLTGGQSKTYHSLPGNRTLIYDPLFFVYP